MAVKYVPGDIFVTHAKGFVPRVIALGERLRGSRKDSRWTHAGIIIDEDGTTIEMWGKGATSSTISYHPVHEILDSQLDTDGRTFAVDFARSLLTWDNGKPVRYGYLDILSIAIDLLTPSKLDFRSSRALICSQAAAMAIFHGGAEIPTLDLSHVMPSDLASWFPVRDK